MVMLETWNSKAFIHLFYFHRHHALDFIDNHFIFFLKRQTIWNLTQNLGKTKDMPFHITLGLSKRSMNQLGILGVKQQPKATLLLCLLASNTWDKYFCIFLNHRISESWIMYLVVSYFVFLEWFKYCKMGGEAWERMNLFPLFYWGTKNIYYYCS